MNMIHRGLYRPESILDMNTGEEKFEKLKSSLIQQSADIVLVCAHALDSTLDSTASEVEEHSIREASSRLCWQAWNDITTAQSLE